jgi:metal-sulfur cluster biosynthetic enzyme
VERAMQVWHQPDSSDLVLAVLRTVVEPHLGVNVVDLGLVYDVGVMGERVRVVLGVLTPQDAESAELEQRVRQAIRGGLPQFKQIEISIAHDRIWHPGRMSLEARWRLGL